MHDHAFDLGLLVRRAFEIASETDTSDRATAFMRAHIARVAQQAGICAEFGAGCLEEVFAAETKARRDQGSESPPERQAELQRIANMNQLAKDRLLIGNLHEAEKVYLAAEELRPHYERHGLLGTHVTFLSWLLEAGDLSRSIELFHSVDWAHSFTQFAMARRIAHTLIEAGQRLAGLDLLRSLCPAPNAASAHMTFSCLGQALWVLDETEEGVAAIREASRLSLARAVRDERIPLYDYLSSEPIALAQLQCAIGDCKGATETLSQIMTLAVPIEFDPPPPRPADLPAFTLFISGGPKLKPACKRWLASLPDLIRVLARADLDDVALSLVASVGVGQLKLLTQVARGQARRGAYAKAFQTIERMNAADLLEANEPSQMVFQPDGTVTAFTQNSPTRPVEIMERTAAVWDSLNQVRMYAADAGDADAFRLAQNLRRQLPSPRSHDQADLLHFNLLINRGEFEQAIASVNVIPTARDRLLALRYVVDLAAKAAKSTRDDVLSACYR